MGVLEYGSGYGTGLQVSAAPPVAGACALRGAAGNQGNAGGCVTAQGQRWQLVYTGQDHRHCKLPGSRVCKQPPGGNYAFTLVGISRGSSRAPRYGAKLVHDQDSRMGLDLEF